MASKKRKLFGVAGEFEYTGKGSVPNDVTRVKFHSSVTEVGKEAFLGRENLKEVEFNEGLQKIGVSSFLCCISLDSIRFPSTVTEVGIGAFSGCAVLKGVELNEGLQKIGWGAFSKCRSLDSIRFPS
ncbi:hypothetical protein ACHAXR_000342, partial [Thalassiosira sp. AJA248-18]